MTTSWGLLEQEGHSRVESDGRIVNEYTESYIYTTDSMTRPTKQDILSDMGATPGSPYFDDVKATLYDATVRAHGNMTRPPHLQFLVILQWSTGATLPASTDPDPTTRRTIWTVKPIIQQRFVIKDRNDDLIINTAGQTPDGGVPVDVRMGTVVATRNVTAVGYNRNAVLANSGKLNSVTYLGGDPGTVQVDIESVETFQGAYHFYAETYTFSYDPRGMQPHFASAGFSAINDAGQLAKILLEDGSQPSEPEPLDTAGKWVPIADRPADCAIMEVDYFEEMAFASFGL